MRLTTAARGRGGRECPECVVGKAWGAEAENDSRAQRNTKKVDPSTNRRGASEATMLRLH
jgi:hypothetical protein